MEGFNKIILAMALLRFLSGSIELLAGLTMIKLNDVNKALILNSTLAIIGPTILILTTTIGIFGISERLSYNKLGWIVVGIVFILIGLRK